MINVMFTYLHVWTKLASTCIYCPSQYKPLFIVKNDSILDRDMDTFNLID